jgi:hypothetical protein
MERAHRGGRSVSLSVAVAVGFQPAVLNAVEEAGRVSCIRSGRCLGDDPAAVLPAAVARHHIRNFGRGTAPVANRG